MAYIRHYHSTALGCKDKYVKWYIKNILKSEVEYERMVKDLKGKIEHNEDELRGYLLNALKDSGLTQSEVCKTLGNQMARHYFNKSQWNFPTRANYIAMQSFMPALTYNYDELVGLQRLQSLQRLQLSYSKVPLAAIKAQYGKVVFSTKLSTLP